jgi:hypothetical protein
MKRKDIKTNKKRRLFTLIFALILISACCLSTFPPLSPTKSIVNTIGFIATRRLHFPSQNLGKEIADEEGNNFTIFREVVVDPTSKQPTLAGVTLILHFRVTNMTPEQNKIYSLLPLPLYIGDPGFRRKLFTINGDNCQSIYEWDTVQDAENYLNSYALKTILMRSVSGSFSYKIIENK